MVVTITKDGVIALDKAADESQICGESCGKQQRSFRIFKARQGVFQRRMPLTTATDQRTGRRPDLRRDDGQAGRDSVSRRLFRWT